MSEGIEKVPAAGQNQNAGHDAKPGEDQQHLAPPPPPAVQTIRSNLMRSIGRSFCSLCSKPVQSDNKTDKNLAPSSNMKEHDRHLVDIVVELLPKLAHALSKGNDKWIFCAQCKLRLVDLQLLASIRNAIGLMHAGVREELVGEIGNSRTAKRERSLARKSKLMECLEESPETNIIGGLQIDLDVDGADNVAAPNNNSNSKTDNSLTITPQAATQQQSSPSGVTIKITTKNDHKNKQSFHRNDTNKYLHRSTSSSVRRKHHHHHHHHQQQQQQHLQEEEGKERRPVMVFTTPGDDNVHDNVEYADITSLFEQLQLRKADSGSKCDDLTDKISLASSTSSKCSEDTVTSANSSVFGAMKGQLIERKRRRPLNDSEVAKFPQLPRALKLEANTTLQI